MLCSNHRLAADRVFGKQSMRRKQGTSIFTDDDVPVTGCRSDNEILRGSGFHSFDVELLEQRHKQSTQITWPCVLLTYSIVSLCFKTKQKITCYSFWYNWELLADRLFILNQKCTSDNRMLAVIRDSSGSHSWRKLQWWMVFNDPFKHLTAHFGLDLTHF